MQIELKDKDLKILAELAFVGDWMINSVRLHDEQVKKYRRVCNAILKHCLKSLSDKERGEIKSVDDLRDFYTDELSKYADHYDEKTLIPRLAENLSEINYPDECGENVMMSFGIQGSARHIYEDLLKEKGLGIIKIDCPEFDEQMAASREYWQLIYGKSDIPQEERMTKAKALADAMREKREKKKSE